MSDLLVVEDLSVSFGDVTAVDRVSLRVGEGECVAVVGESGSGKSLTAMSIVRLLPAGARMDAGALRLAGTDVLRAGPRAMDAVRGGSVGVLFQQPARMLDPTSTVGAQMAEPVRRSLGLRGRRARSVVADLLADVGITEPARCARSYAHQLSGGMAQRVMLATALAGRPRLLIADEPTTGLDVTLEARALDLLASKQRESGLAVLLVSHDLRVVAGIADRIVVLYGGRVVEEGSAHQVLEAPVHPYTRALVACSELRAGADGEFFSIGGSPSSAALVDRGCRFAPRCAVARIQGLTHRCTSQEPPLAPSAGVPESHRSRCWASVHDEVGGRAP